jgi:hypothetical protein
MAKAVMFTNWMEKEFTWNWGGEPYTFPPGKTIYLEDFKANHFANHLVDQYLNDKGLPTNHFSRQELVNKCVKIESTVEAEPSKLNTEMLNKNAELSVSIPKAEEPKKEEPAPKDKNAFCQFCDSKGIRHKKECTRTEIVPAKA